MYYSIVLIFKFLVIAVLREKFLMQINAQVLHPLSELQCFVLIALCSLKAKNDGSK
jgi:hypothetical protein